MLCSVVAEAACSTSEEVVHVGHVVELEIGVFGVNVGKSAHLTGCALETVVIVLDFVETICVIEVFVTTDGGIECIAHASVVDRGVVG